MMTNNAYREWIGEPTPSVAAHTALEREPKSTTLIAFKDCDAFGLLYNTRYLDYMMDARAEHLLRYYGLDFYAEMKRTRQTWVVQGHQVAYLGPARAHETVVMRTRLIDAGASTCMFEAMMLDEQETCIKALQWTKLSYVQLPQAAAVAHPSGVQTFLAGIRARDDIPEPLQFDARVAQLRARFQPARSPS